MICFFSHDYHGNLHIEPHVQLPKKANAQYIAYETSKKGDLVQQELLGWPGCHMGMDQYLLIPFLVG